MRRVPCLPTRTRGRSRAFSSAMPMRGRSTPLRRAGTAAAQAVRKTCRGSTAWTDSIMRCWKKFISILFSITAVVVTAACARDDGARFSVREATVAGDTLSAQVDWRPSETLLDGLDHGIPLVFDISLSAQAPGKLGLQMNLARQRWRRELRYFPLTRQYQLRDPDNTTGAARSGTQARSYAVRALVIA